MIDALDAPLGTAMSKARARRCLRRLTGFASQPLCQFRGENPQKFPERASRARPRVLVSGRARL